MKRLSKILDDLSEFLAARKGLVPMIGIVFVLVNFVLQFYPGEGLIVKSNLFFHLGVILAIIGLLLARAL